MRRVERVTRRATAAPLFWLALGAALGLLTLHLWGVYGLLALIALGGGLVVAVRDAKSGR